LDNIIFEEVKEKHLPEILDIYAFYVLNTTVTFHTHVPSMEEMKEILFFDSPKYGSFVIKDKDQICGYVILSRFSKREAYDITAEVSIYLAPEYTGRGIGGRAIDVIEDFARDNGIQILVAGVCGENTMSIKLFEKKGFVKCGHFKGVGKKFGRLLDLLYFQKAIHLAKLDK